MFDLYHGTERKRRQFWNRRTVVASVVAHAVAIGALVGMAKQADAKTPEEVVIAEWNLDDKPKPPPPPKVEEPTPPPPPKVDPPKLKEEPVKMQLAPKEEAPKPEPASLPAPPVKGDFVAVKPPTAAPVGIPAPDPNAAPARPEDFSGVGKEGDVVGEKDASDTRAPTGNTEPAQAEEKHEEAPVSNEPMEASAVEVRPSLRNSSEVQRALQRDYPPLLRDSGVTGETVLQFVIDEDGRVEPGSVEVVSTTNDEFAAAARRVVSTMRFSPGRVGDRKVRVITTMPVRWEIAN